jgi:hypothetical protein
LLRRADRAAEAAELILSVPRDPAQAIDPDQWWIERRLVARQLLDLADATRASHIAPDAAGPSWPDQLRCLYLGVDGSQTGIQLPPSPTLPRLPGNAIRS